MYVLIVCNVCNVCTCMQCMHSAYAMYVHVPAHVCTVPMHMYAHVCTCMHSAYAMYNRPIISSVHQGHQTKN